MRVLIAALLLSACATTSAPPDQIEGCWVERTAQGGSATMAWYPDAANAGVLIGDYLPNRESRTGRRYTLTPPGDAWTFCQTMSDDTQRCWQVAHGDSGSLEGGRAFIDLHGRRLRIAILDGSFERVVFSGVRASCD